MENSLNIEDFLESLSLGIKHAIEDYPNFKSGINLDCNTSDVKELTRKIILKGMSDEILSKKVKREDGLLIFNNRSSFLKALNGIGIVIATSFDIRIMEQNYDLRKIEEYYCDINVSMNRPSVRIGNIRKFTEYIFGDGKHWGAYH